MKQKHENYEVLNLIGYGLAKFDMQFVVQFGFKYKAHFFQYFVNIGIAETVGVVKNRQDLFDPFFDNGRKGWWQQGERYIHRKTLIDSLFGNEGVDSFTQIVKLYLKKKVILNPSLSSEKVKTSPIIQSKFKQLQLTGRDAELYFLHHFQQIDFFKEGHIEDARLFGDGYDFQIEVPPHFYLAEVKGVKLTSGSIRLTKNEYFKAKEYKEKYALVVISNLVEIPKITVIKNPTKHIEFNPKTVTTTQLSYHSKNLTW